jgi:DNA/RNA-binding domain of Phe-tRNA-synthetase-like protein
MQMIADVSVRLSAKRFSSLFKVFLVTIIQIDNGSAHTQKKKDATLLLHVAVVREMSPLCTDATTLCFLVGQFFFFSLKSQLPIVIYNDDESCQRIHLLLCRCAITARKEKINDSTQVFSHIYYFATAADILSPCWSRNNFMAKPT